MKNDLIQHARTYATSMHKRINQRRKYTLAPYHVHLNAVANLVAAVSDDPQMIAAAWLHDTVEDTPATFADLEREFGEDVMLLVMELTDISRPSDGNRVTRKTIDRLHLAKASQRAKTVKLADVIDNTRDISKHDHRFARVFLPEMHELLHVLREGDKGLYAMACATVDSCAKQLQLVLPPPDCQHGQDSALDDPARQGSVFSQYQGIQLFATTFTARHILETLPSLDSTTSLDQLKKVVIEGQHQVVGIRFGGHLTCYLTNADSVAANGQLQPRPILSRQVVELDAPLVDVIHILTVFDCCFVAIFGTIIGVIQRSDLEKPVVRMWLFGLIMLIDMNVSAAIKQLWPDKSWQSLLASTRLEKAKKLFAERQRCRMSGELLDCLQLADKMQLLMHSHSFLEQSGFASLNAARRVFKDLETLRNNLAHGQNVTRTDWPSIIRLARQVGAING